MYVKTKCPHCGEVNFSDVDIKVFEDEFFSGIKEAKKYAILNIECKASVGEKELLIDVARALNNSGAMTRAKLPETLSTIFGISGVYAAEFAEKLAPLLQNPREA